MTIAVVINPDTKIPEREIVRMINIWQAVKERRAFNVRVSLRARWRREEEDG